jgi:hypothetical protein
MLRRRVSPLGQQALKAAWELVESASARLIFSSRHGEFGRTLSIMDSLVRQEDTSPADFTLSVHHALAGLLSIARGNHAGHTTVAAGSESLLYGLTEAAACLTEDPAKPVLLVYYDEPLPEPYSHFGRPGEESVALAAVLGADGEGLALRLSTEPSPAGLLASLRPGEDLLNFLEDGATAVTIIGDRLTWRIEKIDAAA